MSIGAEGIIKRGKVMSAPSKACDMQLVKIRYRESQASALLPNVQTRRQRIV